MRRRENCV